MKRLRVRTPSGIPTTTEDLHNGDNDIDDVNKHNIKDKIEELETLLVGCKNQKYRVILLKDLTSYKAIKKLFDDAV